MSFKGACPSCGASIDFGAAPPPADTCRECRTRYVVLIPEVDEATEVEDELILLAAGEEPLPEPVRMSGQFLMVGLAGFLLLLGLGSLFGAIYIRQDPVQEAPLGVAVAVFGFGLAFIAGAGLIVWLLVAPARRAGRP